MTGDGVIKNGFRSYRLAIDEASKTWKTPKEVAKEIGFDEVQVRDHYKFWMNKGMFYEMAFPECNGTFYRVKFRQRKTGLQPRNRSK